MKNVQDEEGLEMVITLRSLPLDALMRCVHENILRLFIYGLYGPYSRL